jgi:succinate dehydrogenase / fumarate reductase, membrane anchor subunit
MANRSPLGRVRGLGSAKEGAHHWWTQRVTAAANLVLMLWFAISLALLPGYDYAAVTAWLASPWAAIPMLLLIVSVFYHFRLGLQVVIEDYVHDEGRVALMLLLTFFTIGTGAIAAFSVLKIAFTGTPA